MTATGELDAIERALALAPLVLVPLALRTAVSGASRLRSVGSRPQPRLQPVGALLCGSLVIPSPARLAAALARRGLRSPASSDSRRSFGLGLGAA